MNKTDIDVQIEQAISQYKSTSSKSFSFAEINAIGAIAHQAALQVGVPIVFSLVDANGIQRYFFSMNNALLISQKLACKKAWTAAALKMSTYELMAEVQPGTSLYGLQNDTEVCCIGGGVPLWSNNVFLGAIGVSGGTVEQDMEIAHRTLRQFSREHFLIKSSL